MPFYDPEELKKLLDSIPNIEFVLVEFLFEQPNIPELQREVAERMDVASTRDPSNFEGIPNEYSIKWENEDFEMWEAELNDG